MVWIVVAYATANAAIENVMGQTYRGQTPRASAMRTPSARKTGASLLALAGLVRRADLLPGLGQNASHFARIGASGRQVEILLVSRGAVIRQNDAVGLGIDGRVLHQSLALDVVENGIGGIHFDGLIRRCNLSCRVVLLEEDHGLVAQMKRGARGVGFGCRIVSSISFGNLAAASVHLAQPGLRHADHFHARLL